MAALTRPEGHKRVGGSRTLTVDHPQTKPTLAALDLDGEALAGLRYWSNTLHREADAWMRRGGFAERGWITKGDANRLLKIRLAELGGGGR